MTAELEEGSEFSQQTEGQTQPAFSWSDAELMRFLAAAWGQESPSNIQVIGRLSQTEGTSFGFLKDLHHPVTGIGLPAPTGSSKVLQGIFVPPGEFQRLNQGPGATEYAIASVELSPLPRRRERDDPLACTVRAGTLTPLTSIPSGWGVYGIATESASLITETARELIEGRLRVETSEAESELDAVRSKLAEAHSEHARLGQELKGILSEMKDAEGRISALKTDEAEGRKALETKLRELEALLKEKGERMVALRLVEDADLEKLFPSSLEAPGREGHVFQTALGGDLNRLASYVQAHLWRKGMHFSRAQLLDFITLLRTNDLIILAGDSGSGKTSLVKSVADAIGGKCKVVPVKPNWTSSEDLLGYYNPIEGRYHPTQFLLALLEAAREPEVPHFICLDEMNLARVEYYFADFLSLLETRGTEPWIHLFASVEERQTAVDSRLFLTLEQEARDRAGLPTDASLEDILLNDKASLELRKLAGFQESDTVLAHHAKLRRSLAGLMDIPPAFRFPRNAWIVGAINVDETTHYLSPKILDRAHVMRFRNPVLVDWEVIEGEVEAFDIDISLPVILRADDIGDRAPYPNFDRQDPLVSLLTRLSRMYLDPLGVEFGLRAIRQSLNYLEKATDAGLGRQEALNNIVLHKILPKMVVELDKTTATGAKRRDLLAGLRGALEGELDDLDRALVTESALDGLDELMARAEGNNGIANFWAR